MWGAAAVAAGTAIAGWLSSEQGRKASKQEREKMQAMLDGLKDPSFDTRDIDFPTFQVLQRYVPQVADFVQERDPRFVEMSAEASEGRSAQLEALRRLQQAGSSEGDILQDIAINQANREAAKTNRGMQDQILEGFRRRGMGGSGMELAAALSAQQSAAERGALSSEAAAAEAYRNRLNALMQSGELGGRIKNEEMDAAARNASILNDWNQRKASNQNAYNRYRDELANKASLYNIGEGQRVYEKNTGGRYDADVRNQQNRNDMAQRKFQNAMSKITGQQAQSAMNQNAITQNTQDRNNMIQGIGNIGSAYFDRQDDIDQREKDREAMIYASTGKRASDVWGK